MFTELHAMAKSAMLLMTATAEGDQLRVSITPTYPDGKAPAGRAALRPMSLVGTPDELNADFAAALAVWQAPKRSIIEQAQAAADDSGEAAPVKAIEKAPPKAADAKPKTKGTRKTAAAAATQEEAGGTADSDDAAMDDAAGSAAPDADAAPAAYAQPAAAPAPAETADLAAAAAPATEAGSVPAPVQPAAEVVDIHTLDLF